MGKYDKKVYVISSIQAMQSENSAKSHGPDISKGAPNRNLIKGLEKYCEVNDAELMLLTMHGMNAGEKKLHPFFHGDIWESVYLPDRRNIRLNNNCIVSDMLVPPQNVDPATGRDRFVQSDQTMIYAHSKQRFKTVAAGNRRLPKILATTGACTFPNYNENNHRGDVARREHAYGAVIAEIIDDTCFNVRHIRSHRNGKFIDMGTIYNGNEIESEKATVDALVLGDLHLGDHDPKTVQANYEMIEHFQPKRLFLHDLLNGHSVNPHERKKLMMRTIAYEQGRLSIEDELKAVNKELNYLARMMNGGEVNVVFSNHDFFLERYLEGGDFIKEPWNTRIAMKLGQAVLNEENPAEVGIRMMGQLHSNVNFLELRDDYKRWGWQLASHGHKGISGARGSERSRQIGHGKSITGHTHAPVIKGDVVIVGTSTKLDLPYTEGSMSCWMAANAVLYEGGLVQLLPIVDGKWRMYK